MYRRILTALAVSAGVIASGGAAFAVATSVSTSPDPAFISPVDKSVVSEDQARLENHGGGLPGRLGGQSSSATPRTGDDNDVDHPAANPPGDDDEVDHPAAKPPGDDNDVDPPAANDPADDNGVDHPDANDPADDNDVGATVTSVPPPTVDDHGGNTSGSSNDGSGSGDPGGTDDSSSSGSPHG
jgi:hypothetical protein